MERKTTDPHMLQNPEISADLLQRRELLEGTGVRQLLQNFRERAWKAGVVFDNFTDGDGEKTVPEISLVFQFQDYKNEYTVHFGEWETTEHVVGHSLMENETAIGARLVPEQRIDAYRLGRIPKEPDMYNRSQYVLIPQHIEVFSSLPAPEGRLKGNKTLIRNWKHGEMLLQPLSDRSGLQRRMQSFFSVDYSQRILYGGFTPQLLMEQQQLDQTYLGLIRE